ncbi:unnamed protein product [Toxocara canis]|uniref:Uncharacterized protein n=1 Tax=Toxocara canis TaxID=6265 RepID=A0A183U153_TOXCA|nr:unnamed protein product [Toxocara canis]
MKYRSEPIADSRLKPINGCRKVMRIGQVCVGVWCCGTIGSMCAYMAAWKFVQSAHENRCVAAKMPWLLHFAIIGSCAPPSTAMRSANSTMQL